MHPYEFLKSKSIWLDSNGGLIWLNYLSLFWEKKLISKHEENDTNFENVEKCMDFVKRICYDLIVKVLDDMQECFDDMWELMSYFFWEKKWK